MGPTNSAIRKYQLKSGREKYEFSIRVNSQKIIHRRGFLTFKEANLAYLDLKQQIIRGSYLTLKAKIKYQDLYQTWIKRYANEVKESTLNKTIRTFELHILPYFGSKYLDQITVAECQKAVDQWSLNLVKYKFISNYAEKIFAEALRLSYLEKNPFNQVIVPKITNHVKEVQQGRNNHNFYNKEELARFLKTTKERMPWQIYTFFRLLAYSGLRRGEILALTWGDLNFKAATLTVQRTISVGLNYQEFIAAPKSIASQRTLVLDAQTLRILRQWQKKQEQELAWDIVPVTQFIFQDPQNQHYPLARPRQWLQKIIRWGQLPPITIHGFRHTHATLLYDENPYITPKDVQRRLGHAKVDVTMNIYEHTTSNSDSKILQAMNQLSQESQA
ncbi:site-specific integrase [Lactobacillus sp. DCY120]|uniref:Site-specific integrase n=1 Tax=Bombilactobacillus apium TaxID=2675299 RepID=A0A850R5Q0_9LACO|nr:site-specific integrase [Bombilactobacillus apium]NVY95865.1 site-specific integrase [Bombilactobacillus apium]